MLKVEPPPRATGSQPGSPSLSVGECSDSLSWDQFVDSRPDGTICHRFGWKQVIEQSYRQRAFYLAAHRDQRICGVLPLVRTHSWLFGNHVTSMPYLDDGGILAEAEDAKQALWKECRTICRSAGATLNLRFRRDPQLDLPPSLKRVTMMLELGDCVDNLWKRLPSERRNRIRKGQKNHLVASWHGEDGLRDFFNVFARNMRDLGSPVHGKDFFRSILQVLEEHSAILLVRDGGLVIGAACCLFHGDTMSIPWVSALRSHFKRCPNQVLYWEAMRYGIENGFRFLDFGRSARGDGTYEAKRQWGAQPLQLHWIYDREHVGVVAKGNRAARIWRRLPVRLTKWLGPKLRRGLPN